MKRIIALLVLSSTMLVGCQKGNDTSSSSHRYEPYYKDVENLHIEWNDMFNQSDDKYYVYAYSVTCTACSMLREEIIDFAKASYVNFYFIYPSDDINFVDTEEEAYASKGATAIENVSIYTTPTLIEITNRTITDYTRDYYEIKHFIESFPQ